MKQKGILVVVSGPAGSGKGTVIKEVLDSSPDFAYSVSATTRKPRPGEIDGINYYFVSKEEFEEKIKNDEVLEYTNYCGNYYGTPKDKVMSSLENKNVILEIEVEGAMNVKKKFKEALLILLIPPNFKTLEARLRGRGTESEDVIQKRLNQAKNEIGFFDSYDYVVVNEDGKIDDCAKKIIEIINTEKLRTERCSEIKENFYEKD